MLGGSVFIAFIRFLIGLVGVILLFSTMSESRFNKKKTILCYSLFSIVVLILTCTWYVLDQKNCVRFVTITVFLCFMVVAIYLSRDSIYLSIYKLALILYLTAIFIIGGIETAILLFNKNIWADIIIRILLVVIIYVVLNFKLKTFIKDFGNYVETEVDKVSVAAMISCILFAIGFILNPNVTTDTPFHLYQIITNIILIGVLQFVLFRLYLHVGKEKEYEREKQLIQLNHRLLEHQLEILEESVESGRRIRHDVRHHNAVMAEFIHRGQYEELSKYIKEYDVEIDRNNIKKLCSNTAVNNILYAYIQKAEKSNIHVTTNINLEKDPLIPSIDLVAIIANAFENALFACMAVQKQDKDRECSIHFMLNRKNNKLVIFCSNTCIMETELNNGKPKVEFTGGIGVSSIIRTAKKYDGEYDFKNNNGIFVFRLIMNIPNKQGGGDANVSNCAM